MLNHPFILVDQPSDDTSNFFFTYEKHFILLLNHLFWMEVKVATRLKKNYWPS